MSILSDATRRQLIDGKSFVLDAPDHVPAIMGHGREVIWAEGESLEIVGPPGVGKTTLMQQAACRRAGVLDQELIGYPVQPDTQRLTLYLALDRPQQIARSFKRMVTAAHAEKLGQLIVWRGPLPFNLVKDPELLATFVQEAGEITGTPIGTVFADSLKDMAAPLSSDEVGAAVNRAIAGVIAQGIEFAATHHQRKATSENKKPTSLADVYGSTWITAGAGSVVLLWGEPGDPIVELTHLKQPAEEVGPLELAHDHREFRGGSRGVSVPLGHGIRYRAGAVRGHMVTVGTHWQTADVGLLTVTNQRAVYHGDRKTLEFLFVKLATLNTYSDAIDLGVTSRQSTSTFAVDDPEFVAGMIRAAFNASTS